MEYFIIYGLLAILSEQCRYIIRNCKIETLNFTMNSFSDEVDKDTENCGVTLNKLQIIYFNIKKSSDLVNKIFGLQVI